MSIVGTTDATPDAQDRVAAFVGGEVRGVAEPQLVAGQWRFFLTLYSRTSGETLAFRYYDARRGEVVDLTETLAFAANSQIGSVQAPFRWHARQVTAFCTPGTPAWTVDASAFSRSMSIVGTTDATPDAQDRVAAFVGGEVRGVAEPQLVAGQWRFFLTLYSRTSGETLAFRYYDARRGEVVGLTEALVFDTNTRVGSVSEPFAWRVLTCGGGITLSARALLEGFFDGTGLRSTRSPVLPETDPYGLDTSVGPGFFTTDPAGQQVADWVLVELRTGDPAVPPMSVVATSAALLSSDGRIVGLDGASPTRFDVPPGFYYLVVRPRNHVPVLSAAPADCTSGTCAYDFTASAAMAYGANAQADLSRTGAGPFALRAGDADGDDDADTDDFLDWLSAFGQANAYLRADLDGDADVDTDDFLLWSRAFGSVTLVPAL